MTKTEREVWVKAVQMDAEAIQAAVSNIYAQMAIIITALKDLDKNLELLRST